MHKHLNKILALLMGALMLLAILPIGAVTTAAEEKEVVIYDHDPRAEHKHEHFDCDHCEHAHCEHDHCDCDHCEHGEKVLTREEFEALKNPNAKTEEEKIEKEKAAPDKVEDPNAHKKPEEPAQPEKKTEPGKRERYAKGTPFVLKDGMTFTPADTNGETKDCPHDNTVLGSDCLNWRYEYTEVLDDNWDHIVNYYETYDLYCDDCGEYLGTVEVYRDYWWESHTYVNEVCTLCGHVNTCPHTGDVSESWKWDFTDTEVIYTEIPGNDYYHNSTGKVIHYTYCCDCGEHLSEQAPVLETIPQDHYYGWWIYDEDLDNWIFVRNGVCSDCGHKCLHSDVYSGSYWIEDNENYPDPYYEEIEGDHQYHNMVGYLVEYTCCDICGLVISEDEPTFTSEPYSHSYYSEDDGDPLECRYCGHSRAAYNDEPLSVGDSTFVVSNNGEVIVRPFTPATTGTYAFSSGSNSDTYGYLLDSEKNLLTYDDDAGNRYNFLIRYELTAGVTYWVGARFYNSEEIGSIPVRIIDTASCTHENTITSYYEVGDGEHVEIPGNNSYHYYVHSVIWYTQCTDCGERFEDEEPTTIEELYWHEYNSEGVCYYCGHVNTCTHENTYSGHWWLDEPTYTEIEGDNRYHIVSGDAVPYTYCGDCGFVLYEGEPEAYTTEDWHYYNSEGVCYNCGHVNTCTHDWVYTWIRWDDVTFIDDPNDNKYHTATGTGYEVTSCEDCGMNLYFGEDQEYTKQENHSYTSSGLCTSCGHVNTCTHANMTTYGWWVGDRKVQDWGDKHQYSGIVEFWEYCSDCDAYYTDKQISTEYYTHLAEHVYDDDGVCYYCSHKDLNFTTQPKDKKVATGKTAKFSVKVSESGAKYQWYYTKNNGEKWLKMSGETGTSISVKASATNNGYLYRCMVTANGGKASSNVAKLTVTGVKPRIATQPKKLTVWVGYTATFKVSAAGTGLSYQWYYSKDNGAKWTKWSGKTSASVSVKSTAKNNGTLYRCVVKNSKGSVTSKSAMMTVEGVKPRILTQPKKATAKLNKTATFKVVAAGTNLKYQWYYSKDNGTTWTKYKGKTSATLKVKGTATTNGYLYRCKITNEKGSVTSKSAKLTVSGVKPKIVVQPKSVSVKSGKTAKFTVVAAGASLKYQWYYSKDAGKTWTKMSGKTAASLSVKASKSNKNYLYRCKITNTKGSVTSKSAKLTVK